MAFVNCNRDHHTIALADTDNDALNHIAFLMPDLELVMRGGGRLKDAGYAIEWGPGRHGRETMRSTQGYRIRAFLPSEAGEVAASDAVGGVMSAKGLPLTPPSRITAPPPRLRQGGKDYRR